MGEERRDDTTTHANSDAAGAHRRGRARTAAIAALLVIGYALAAPVLLTMVDGAPNDAINAWLDHPLRLGPMTLQPIWALAASVIAALVCWLVAALLAHRHEPYGRVSNARSLVRPAVTALTIVCAFFVCMGLPMLWLMHP
ncbi:hypothetical protein PG1616B_0090 [Bifidobacterium pseudolongum subsp. globosum]|nr:hypothetical protein PG1616B_0090 [Bifidobacterium pseudolongum subsp. globosum]